MPGNSPIQGDEPPLREVVIAGLPLALAGRSREWFDGLVREFDIIVSTGDVHGAPERLLEFIDDVHGRFSRFGGESDAEMERAVAEGRETLDLTLRIPVAAGEAARELLSRIHEAIRFCEDGELLTVAAPDDVLRFAAWYLTEVHHQIEGAAPQPWGTLASTPEPVRNEG